MTYYHGSAVEFPIGITVTAKRSASSVRFSHPLILNAEKIIEHYRPIGAVSRFCGLFMTRSVRDIKLAGGHTGNVYRVQPLGIVEPHDWTFMQRIVMMSKKELANKKLVQSLAEAYWSGKRSVRLGWTLKGRRKLPMEYLTRSFVIKELVEEAPSR